MFWAVSQVFRGAKYSAMALASMVFSPVKASSASGQGRDWPISSIFAKRAPTFLSPNTEQRFSGPFHPAWRQAAR